MIPLAAFVLVVISFAGIRLDLPQCKLNDAPMSREQRRRKTPSDAWWAGIWAMQNQARQVPCSCHGPYQEPLKRNFEGGCWTESAPSNNRRTTAKLEARALWRTEAGTPWGTAGTPRCGRRPKSSPSQEYRRRNSRYLKFFGENV